MAKSVKTTGVALVGCGVVGSGVASILSRDGALLQSRSGLKVQLRHVIDVKFDNARRLGLPERLFSSDLDAALKDPDTQIVVELVGGTTFARQVIRRALQAGKDVVTANKALLAHYGSELMALAHKRGRSIAFEASCGGGIPIIRALYDGLIANRIDAIYGIVNGTCNYILTSMTQCGQSYADALAAAQRDGLAEADPTLDVAGIDSAHKLAILASLAFGRRVHFDEIPTAGIDSLELCDIANGQELGYVVKLLAIAQRHDSSTGILPVSSMGVPPMIGGTGVPPVSSSVEFARTQRRKTHGRDGHATSGISLRVRPVFISKEHPLAWVSGPFNAISVYGHLTGHTMYYGRGAGSMPTASAVVADIVSVASGTFGSQFEQLRVWPDRCPKATQLPLEDVRSRFYLRVMALDQPGILAKVASALGRRGISISSLLQREPDQHRNGTKGVPVVITTYKARDGDLTAALAEVNDLKEVVAPTVCIAIVDEHPEQI
jgi:homoserine dehydrogenase